MFDDVVQDVRAHVESVVSAKMGDLEGRLFKFLSGCATDASVRDGSDALKVLLAGVETQFLEEHMVLVDTINAHTAATNAQTALLEAVCGEVKAINEKIGRPLFTHGSSWEHRAGRCDNRQVCPRRCKCN